MLGKFKDECAFLLEAVIMGSNFFDWNEVLSKKTKLIPLAEKIYAIQYLHGENLIPEAEELDRATNFILCYSFYRYIKYKKVFWDLWGDDATPLMRKVGSDLEKDFGISEWARKVVNDFERINNKYCYNYSPAIDEIIDCCSKASGFQCSNEVIEYLKAESKAFENKIAETEVLLLRNLQSDNENKSIDWGSVVSFIFFCFAIYGIYKFLK